MYVICPSTIWLRHPSRESRPLRVRGGGNHAVRTFFLLLFLMFAFRCVSRGDDIVPGIVAFDPPAFLHGGTSGQGSDDKFGRVTGIRQYFAKNNNVGTGERLVVINVREVGFSTGHDMVITYQKLNDNALRTWMQNVMKSSRDATNITKVADAKLGNKPALLVCYQVPQPTWPKKQDALFPFEVYWVRIETNRVMEVELIADTPEHLNTLRPCLDRFAIKLPDKVKH
jgi:hypothetical protein